MRSDWLGPTGRPLNPPLAQELQLPAKLEQAFDKGLGDHAR